MEDAGSAAAAYVEVSGVDRETRAFARRLPPASGEWPQIVDVRAVSQDGSEGQTPVAGKYAVEGDLLRFTPLFPFDPGRRYEVRYRGRADGSAAIRTTVSMRPAAPAAPTVVTRVFPSADVVPENQLRLYIHFSAPMGRRGGLEHVKLLDERGAEVPDPFLPLDAEFWNTDRTRYTVFFDPGRQKRGILPNREMGPSLVAGRRYTLVVDRGWIDGQGHPLERTFTRAFRAGPPELRPLDTASWRVTAPAAGTRDPLSVAFPAPLDHGLLLRAVGVRRDGRTVAGDVSIDAHETRWSLTPVEAWTAGGYELIALSILEDLAGNRIGRAFEVRGFAREGQERQPDVTRIPFSVGGT